MRYDAVVTGDYNHGLREILQSVKGLTEMIADGLPAADRDDLRRLLDQQDRLSEIRWARLEERITAHARLFVAFGGALSGVAAALVALGMR